MITYNEINKVLGNTDLYLVDQILKGQFDHCFNILDAGCGEGRNLRYFVHQHRNVVGIDWDELALKMARMTYKDVAPESFILADLTHIGLPESVFDLAISSAVLHFAKDRNEFLKMMEEILRVLKDQGILFLRMATEIAAPTLSSEVFTYLLSEKDVRWLEDYFEFLEPFKTVVVENRSMAVLVLKKR